jgi:hypothetical protein
MEEYPREKDRRLKIANCYAVQEASSPKSLFTAINRQSVFYLAISLYLQRAQRFIAKSKQSDDPDF